MIDCSDFKKGICIRYKDAPMMIVDVTFSTPTARGGGTIAKTKLRNLITGQLLSDSIRSGERFDEVEHEMRDVQFLYEDGSSWYFMDQADFDQFPLARDVLGDKVGYLVDGIEGVRSVLVEGSVVDIMLPNTVELVVTEADPAIKGASAQAQLKNAVVQTGIEVQVPPYVVVGERIRIDTRDGHFVERVKK